MSKAIYSSDILNQQRSNSPTAIISKKIIPKNSNIEVIDLTNSNTAFDDNIDYEDALEDKPIT